MQTTRYEIRIDALAALDALDLDADALERDDADLDAYAVTALIALAAAVNATFINVAPTPIRDARFSSADVALRFDATPADVARYVTAYDLEPDIDIELV